MDRLAPIESGAAYIADWTWASLKFIVYLLYLATIPIHYPIYYTFAFVVFLFSPIWYMAQLFLGAGLFVANLIARLKYLYIYFACAAVIGICAGAMLHGSTSMLFILLGVHPSQKPATQPPPPAPPQEEPSTEQESGAYSGADSSGLISSESPSFRRKGKDAYRHDMTERERDALYENKWRQSGSSRAPPIPPIKPRRKFRGLLAQTIHEESSESESL
ncbi:uncharacterized protein BCR38DRAFT_6932 [Pseudomassariella vexata]|uniref:Uncharacterized protein n=1 Tax=Pseudomassariella vexata TaxID=1141098 RepID=A0A1Y2EI66_9PEZI|nr:uncharacterized protein BCR38DRAFT_6932 [Pseudomassariella vexata]ORY71269.1 hypothetical protein BCR38DRAFT_6932 [Pseudomassariella vexata]